MMFFGRLFGFMFRLVFYCVLPPVVFVCPTYGMILGCDVVGCFSVVFCLWPFLLWCFAIAVVGLSFVIVIRAFDGWRDTLCCFSSLIVFISFLV